MPAAAAAATILLRLLDTVEANVAGVLADTDTEFLHDLRVSGAADPQRPEAVRRRADRPVRPDRSEAAFFAAEFKWVGDLTTPTRDLDVHLLDFDDTARCAQRGQAGRPRAVPRLPRAAATPGVPRA